MSFSAFIKIFCHLPETFLHAVRDFPIHVNNEFPPLNIMQVL